MTETPYMAQRRRLQELKEKQDTAPNKKVAKKKSKKK